MREKIKRFLIIAMTLLIGIVPVAPSFAQTVEEPTVPDITIVGTVPILGKSTTSVYQMRQWARSKGSTQLFIDLASTFYAVSVANGVDPAVTYTQAAKETNFMKYTGVVTADYHNPCGLKITIGGGDKDILAHKKFDNWDQGITAQVHHLALYAGAKGYPLKNTPDPRHFSSIYGKAKYVEELGSRWAPSINYGNEIVTYMKQLHSFPISVVARVAGYNRYETANKINETAGNNSAIGVFVSGTAPSDALVAASLAKKVGGRVYLTPGSELNTDLINRINAKSFTKVYAVGGTQTISDRMARHITQQGIGFERINGGNRYDTANVVGKMYSSKTAVLVNGSIYSDTLSIAPVAVANGYPLLLTDTNTIPAGTLTILKKMDKVIISGGIESVTPGIESQLKKMGIKVERLSGANRYETSYRIATKYYPNATAVVLATGENYPDSLTGVALANYVYSPILLNNGLSLSNEQKSYLNSVKPSTVYLLGGTESISKGYENSLRSYVEN